MSKTRKSDLPEPPDPGKAPPVDQPETGIGPALAHGAPQPEAVGMTDEEYMAKAREQGLGQVDATYYYMREYDAETVKGEQSAHTDVALLPGETVDDPVTAAALSILHGGACSMGTAERRAMYLLSQQAKFIEHQLGQINGSLRRLADRVGRDPTPASQRTHGAGRLDDLRRKDQG